MAALPAVGHEAKLRARHWDAIVLGSGLAALVTAVRIGMARKRVLVVQEEAASRSFPGLREPFFLAGAREGGVLETCLRELTLPLIDRRRIQPEPIAYQVVGQGLRLDVGRPELTAAELVAWGLAKPDVARSLVRALGDAAEAERDALLAARLVRGRRTQRRPIVVEPGLRGLPAEVVESPPGLRRALAAQVCALSNLATEDPSPEAQARLLGSALAGGAGFTDGPPWLAGLLLARVKSVHGEVRSVAGPIELVSVNGQPGISVPETGDLWVGQALVVGCAESALARALAPKPVPALFVSKKPQRYRAAIHLRARKDVIAEGMAARVIIVPAPANESARPTDEHRRPEAPLVTVSTFPDPGRDELDLVARTIVDAAGDLAARDAEIEERVRSLLPFSDKGIERVEYRRPLWDDDAWLEDPESGDGWPGEIDLRVSSRPAVYRLDRSQVAGLGVEGDLLLGWRSGDVIASELR